MYRYVAFLDSVLDDIEQYIASHVPERGGALLGPVGQPVVTRFVHDGRARRSGSTFSPSRELQEVVSRLERADPSIELKGVVHSHPSAMDHPSQGDHIAFADSLQGVPWLGRFICPIVTRSVEEWDRGRDAREDKDPEHKVPLPSGTMSVFVATMVQGGRVVSEPGVVAVLPITRDLAAVADLVGGELLPLGLTDVDGTVHVSGAVVVGGLELLFLFPATYPNQPPLLLAAARPGAGLEEHPLLKELGGRDGVVPVPLTWDLAVPERERLSRVLGRYPALARSQGSVRASIRSRLHGVVSEKIAESPVLVVGSGSGGSQTAVALVRSGIEQIVLVDPDTVAPENLSRSMYTVQDLGRPKVEALASHLREINPAVRCTTEQIALQDVPRQVIADLVQDAAVVVAATDDPSAQRLLNHFSYAYQVPAVFSGVYAKGQGGEVVFTFPPMTRCFRCATASRHFGLDGARGTDYGTGRLQGEPALGADIQHVVAASVKITVGLLELVADPDGPTTTSKGLLLEALGLGWTYLMTSTTPDFDFFPKLFESVPGQLAYQSVWLAPTGDPDCPVCGDEGGRVHPLQAASRAPRTDRLRVIDLTTADEPVARSSAIVNLTKPSPAVVLPDAGASAAEADNTQDGATAGSTEEEPAANA
ncbi:MAG: ThiF family adenylyltransferase [Kineosporiaceae bacterium]|nr:ThiF family adenylyltransferase [Kineosporiaceae bacterium]